MPIGNLLPCRAKHSGMLLYSFSLNMKPDGLQEAEGRRRERKLARIPKDTVSVLGG